MSILIYNGPGIFHDSFLQALLKTSEICSGIHSVRTISDKGLNESDWYLMAKVLVIPGGRDLLYLKHISDTGIAKIIKFIEEGGNYLGLCGGAYFACDFISFKLPDSKFDVVGHRPLKFFKGRSEGPLFKGFSYKDDSGAYACQIKYNPKIGGTCSSVYYNGGGVFVEPESYNDTFVLAQYTGVVYSFKENHLKQVKLSKNKKACVIECSVGKGKAILSFVHPEITSGPSKTNSPWGDFIENELLRIILCRFGIKSLL